MEIWPYADHRAEVRSTNSHYEVTMWSQSWPKIVKNLPQGCSKVVLQLSKGCFQVVSKLSQICINVSQSCIEIVFFVQFFIWHSTHVDQLLFCKSRFPFVFHLMTAAMQETQSSE